MGMPFLAGVGVMEGDDHKVEEAAREFSIARSHLRDPETGLYYHAWDEAKQQDWADPETGRSRYVWARGLGWYAMALVDILDVIPADKTELRAPLLAIIPELADSLVQDTGRNRHVVPDHGYADGGRQLPRGIRFCDVYLFPRKSDQQGLPARNLHAMLPKRPTPAWSMNLSLFMPMAPCT